MKTFVNLIVLAILQKHVEMINQDATGFVNHGTYTQGTGNEVTSDDSTFADCSSTCQSDSSCLAFQYCESGCTKKCIHLYSTTFASNTLPSRLYEKSTLIPVGFGQKCVDTESVCVGFSKCVDDGTNSGINRCLCFEGFADYNDVCHKVIDSTIDTSGCATCENNKGECIDENYDDTTDKCRCKTKSRSGANCEVNHVALTCSNDAIHICYDKHSDVDFDAGYILFINKDNPKCRGTVLAAANSDPSCPVNKNYVKILFSDANECDMDKITTPLGLMKYPFDIHITNTLGQGHIISMFCSYMMRFQGRVDTGVQGQAGDEQGERKNPSVSFQLRNNLQNQVDYTLTVGDTAYLSLSLTSDDVYGALRMEYCLASSESMLGQRDAIIINMIVDGCPGDDQTIFPNPSDINKDGDPLEVKTSEFQVFKFRNVDEVFFVCSVKLCLKGDESSCDQKTCNLKRRALPNLHFDAQHDTDVHKQDDVNIARIKRDATNNIVDHATVEVPIKVQEKTAGNNDKNRGSVTGETKVILNEMAIGLIIGGLAICILAAILCILACRCMRRNKKIEDDGMPDSSPQFKLPRANCNNMKI